MTTSLISIAIVVISTIFSALGSLFLKIGSANIHKKLLRNIKNHHLMLGVIFFSLPAPMYIIALKYGELNVLYPITALSYIWSTLLAIRFLKENMNYWKYAGIFLIIIGMIFIGLGA